MTDNTLLYARKKACITQKQIANLMGMEQTTYSKKERGLSPIRAEEWIRLAKILNVTIDEIKVKKNEFEDSKKRKKISLKLNLFQIVIRYNKILEQENASLKEILKNQSINNL